MFSILFLENARKVIFWAEVTPHSNITGKMNGYVHNFCNQKVRESKNQTSFITQNLFGFDFFFFKKKG